MRYHRKTTSTAAVVLALLASAPAAAMGNPLLSGYGGPGLGSQAILGATLLGGPNGGAGGSAAGGKGSPIGGASRSGLLAEPSSGLGAAGAAASAAGGGSAEGSPGVHLRGPRAAGVQAQPAHSPKLYPASERELAQPSGALGLSTGDLLLILLTIVVLTATGLVTSRLTAAPAARRRAG